MTETIMVGAGVLRLVLTPKIGGAVHSFTRAGEPVFRTPLPGAVEAGLARDLASYPLFPFSNRVANRRFSFAGRKYELPDLLRGWAIHGAGWQLPWNATHVGGTATLTLDYPGGSLWPFAFHAEQHFALSASGLEWTLSIRNDHTTPAPAGFGQHPFFPRSPEAMLRFTASSVSHNGPDMIPTRITAVPPEWNHSNGRRVGEVALDNCFSGWGGMASILYPDRGFSIAVTADPVFQHLIVFIPPGQPFFAVEPVSNATDGLNRMDTQPDHGIFVLEPGETRAGHMAFMVEAL